MFDKIEVYIKKEEVVVGKTVIGFPIPEHGMCSWKDTMKTEKVMPEADSVALEVAKDVAKERGIKVEVIDISTFMGKLKAISEGVKKTPTIIVGERKIEGVPNKDQILKLLALIHEPRKREA
jgi:hypothetical protein